ncbi:hypothetical protein CFC21_007497, partial [Triticum aestivum]
ADM